MNFSEFKRLLGAEPFNRDPKTLHARNSAPEFEQAAREAEAFERKLQRAVKISVDEFMLDEILEIPNRPRPGRVPRWAALAASVLVVAGAVWVQAQRPGTIEEYVARHHTLDGVKVLNQAKEPLDGKQVGAILAGLGVSAAAELADRIVFIKYCPTMDGRGIHMVVSTEHGPMQVIYMPETRVEEGREFRFAQMQAHLVNLARGSAAVIGRLDQPVSGMDSLLRESLITAGAGA
jgi:hypothetical protein